eukprot:TRINITY_DN9625_c0_g4_i2.p2 TRINITY_DN9625_c0_g4~~TRINITY_DN9625_c0_g4_i2.p2  ORF type:complete len:492 (-),score=96.80 TRINITY_DN9625_c0_g4_i2:1660-3135(-)
MQLSLSFRNPDRFCRNFTPIRRYHQTDPLHQQCLKLKDELNDRETTLPRIRQIEQLVNQLPDEERNFLRGGLVSRYANYDARTDAERVFSLCSPPGARMFYNMMSCDLRHGELQSALDRFGQMLELNVPPQNNCWGLFLNYFDQTGNLMQAYDMFSRGSGSKFPPHEILWRKLLGAFINSGDADGEILTYRKMKEIGFHLDVAHWTMFLRSLGEVGRISDMLSFLEEMRASTTPPNNITWGIIFSALKEAQRIDEMVNLFHQGKESADVLGWNVVVDTLSKSGRVDEALRIVDGMKGNHKPTTVTWTTILAGLGNAGRWDEMRALFEEKKKIFKSPSIWSPMIKSYGERGLIDEALSLFQEMRQVIPSDAQTWGNILTQLGHANRIDEMMAMFHSNKAEIIATYKSNAWNSVLSILEHANRFDEMMSVFQEMKVSKVALDVITYPIIIRGLSRSKRHEEMEEIITQAHQRFPKSGAIDAAIARGRFLRRSQ